MTISRGMASMPCKKAIIDRFVSSKKSKLILLVVSDLDPAGDAIAEDLVKCFRRDFGIGTNPDPSSNHFNIEAYKVALTYDQVAQHMLEPSMDAKENSPTYQKFVDTYGITEAYELEAMEPKILEETLSEAIERLWISMRTIRSLQQRNRTQLR